MFKKINLNDIHITVALINSWMNDKGCAGYNTNIDKNDFNNLHSLQYIIDDAVRNKYNLKDVSESKRRNKGYAFSMSSCMMSRDGIGKGAWSMQKEWSGCVVMDIDTKKILSCGMTMEDVEHFYNVVKEVAADKALLISKSGSGKGIHLWFHFTTDSLNIQLEPRDFGVLNGVCYNWLLECLKTHRDKEFVDKVLECNTKLREEGNDGVFDEHNTNQAQLIFGVFTKGCEAFNNSFVLEDSFLLDARAAYIKVNKARGGAKNSGSAISDAELEALKQQRSSGNVHLKYEQRWKVANALWAYFKDGNKIAEAIKDIFDKSTYEELKTCLVSAAKYNKPMNRDGFRILIELGVIKGALVECVNKEEGYKSQGTKFDPVFPYVNPTSITLDRMNGNKDYISNHADIVYNLIDKYLCGSGESCRYNGLRLCVNAPTGAGKSYVSGLIASHMMNNSGMGVIIVSPTNATATQMQAELHKLYESGVIGYDPQLVGAKFGYGEYESDKMGISRKTKVGLYCGVVDSVLNMINREHLVDSDRFIIIFDEAHNGLVSGDYRGITYRSWMDTMNKDNWNLITMTATPSCEVADYHLNEVLLIDIKRELHPVRIYGTIDEVVKYDWKGEAHVTYVNNFRKKLITIYNSLNQNYNIVIVYSFTNKKLVEDCEFTDCDVYSKDNEESVSFVREHGWFQMKNGAISAYGNLGVNLYTPNTYEEEEYKMDNCTPSTWVSDNLDKDVENIHSEETLFWRELGIKKNTVVIVVADEANEIAQGLGRVRNLKDGDIAIVLANYSSTETYLPVNEYINYGIDVEEVSALDLCYKNRAFASSFDSQRDAVMTRRTNLSKAWERHKNVYESRLRYNGFDAMFDTYIIPNTESNSHEKEVVDAEYIKLLYTNKLFPENEEVVRAASAKRVALVDNGTTRKTRGLYKSVVNKGIECGLTAEQVIECLSEQSDLKRLNDILLKWLTMTSLDAYLFAYIMKFNGMVGDECNIRDYNVVNMKAEITSVVRLGMLGYLDRLVNSGVADIGSKSDDYLKVVGRQYLNRLQGAFHIHCGVAKKVFPYLMEADSKYDSEMISLSVELDGEMAEFKYFRRDYMQGRVDSSVTRYEWGAIEEYAGFELSGEKNLVDVEAAESVAENVVGDSALVELMIGWQTCWVKAEEEGYCHLEFDDSAAPALFEDVTEHGGVVEWVVEDVEVEEIEGGVGAKDATASRKTKKSTKKSAKKSTKKSAKKTESHRALNGLLGGDVNGAAEAGRKSGSLGGNNNGGGASGGKKGKKVYVNTCIEGYDGSVYASEFVWDTKKDAAMAIFGKWNGNSQKKLKALFENDTLHLV